MTATKSINNLYLSEHLKTDRADRMVEILISVGIGVVKWVRQSTKDPGIEYRFSSTGVMFVVAKEYDLITTAYIVNSKKVSAIFDGNAPKELWKKVLENEKKGLTHNQGYGIIALERNERMIKMLTLNYNDLTDNHTFTYQLVKKHQEDIEQLEKKLAREKEFYIDLCNYLQTHKELSLELYNYAVAYLERTNKKISEIFEEIKNEG